MNELIIDSFAGGGGASEGIRQALGRSPHVAVNHDRFALAMHRANHPETHHMLQDVATVDAVGMCQGRPIGMLWMSPDCTDHSKAKGAAPRRDGSRTTRGIGWAVFGWVKVLPRWQRPRVIFLENVEEYVDWGPLLPDGTRCPKRKGETFKAFVAAWRSLGYVVEWRERRAWWSGAATIRKRLFMIMRRDGKSIVWPERRFGNPNDAGDRVRIERGDLLPWPIVADCIDFTLPIPSIFDTREHIKATLGLTAKRPLAANTEARIAKGVLKRVLQRRPFIVKASAGDQNAVVAPYLVPRYMDTRPGRQPRSHPIDKPSATIMPGGQEGSLIAVNMVTMRPSGCPDSSADAPARTFMANGAHETVVAAFMAQHSAGTHPGQPSREVDAPLSTLTVRGTQQNVVAVSMLTMRGSARRTAAADEPARTVSCGGQHHALVSMPMMTVYYGTDADGASIDEPGRTDTAKARFGLVSALASIPAFSTQHEDKARTVAAFMRKYGCWDGGEFVTLVVDGVTLVLVDICMRMLTPRERYNANGFPRGYVIDHGIDADGSRIKFTLEQQGHMCGNSVCPSEAHDLVAANYAPADTKQQSRKAQRDLPLLQAAE